MQNLETLLGTSDQTEQANIVEQLIQIASTPVITMIIQSDPRSPLPVVQVIGPNISFVHAYQLLEAARQSVMAQERQAMMEEKLS